MGAIGALHPGDAGEIERLRADGTTLAVRRLWSKGKGCNVEVIEV
jgi:hypothetical protein